MLDFKHVKKTFKTVTVLNDLNLHIDTGELFVLVGPSGSGKTTTLKMINRLIEPTSGTINFENQNIDQIPLHALRSQIGYVLQQIALFPNMTVAENISLLPELQKWPKNKQRERVDALLTRVGLPPEAYRKRMPSDLSGGEQQRIGILRAIATKPKLILMDEPFSALDPISKKTLQDIVIDLHEELHNTIIFITHDMSEALRLGTRVGVMHDGNLIQVGTPDEIRNAPKNDFISEFFGLDVSNTQFNLAEMIQKSFSLPIDELANNHVISTQTTFKELISLLSKYTIINVKDNNQNLIGAVDAQCLIRYGASMSDSEVDDQWQI
ncbi:ABC transporter ATP-binding protein [Dellaglioa sp. P0083]|uniref:ABC transporter ATP-binding protein n=1 Tax=Dellaglioa kimchii TaxID=3344667 RepID=UPI0038D4E137